MTTTELGRRIRRLREGKGWSLSDLARRMRVGRSKPPHKSTISKMETGHKNTWDLALIARLERVFELRPGALLADEEREGDAA